MIRVGLLYGGRSGEHEVSLCSAASVAVNLDADKYEIVAIGIGRDGRWHVQDSPVVEHDKDFGKKLVLEDTGTWYVNHFEENGKLRIFNPNNGRYVSVDVVFPVVHGTYCEDGTLQGLLELARVPYVGADVLGSSVGMDKDVAKRLLRDAGIPIVPWITITERQWVDEKEQCERAVVSDIGLPAFVKPANAGSSVGIKKISEAGEISAAVQFALRFDTKVLVEKAVTCREIECSVLGNAGPEASCLGEIIPHHEFYSYEAKYIDPEGAELVIPAVIDGYLSEMIRETALEAYRALCCSGMARIDFFLERNSNTFYLNEINTLPGFTIISMYPKLWEKSGIGYASLLDKLIDCAIERSKKKSLLKTEM